MHNDIQTADGGRLKAHKGEGGMVGGNIRLGMGEDWGEGDVNAREG